MQSPSEVEFQAHLIEVVGQLRGALTELLSSVEADASVPYALARRMGVNKTLAWKICRIISSQDPFQIIDHLPGDQGFEILLTAFGAHGAPPAALTNVRGALDELARLVDTHAGNRRTLKLMVASHPEPQQAQIEESRRLAYEGNSVIWGLQGRVRFASYFVVPNRDAPEMVDCTVFGGLVDVRRLRPHVGAPVFIMRSYNDDGTVRPAEREPLDANHDGDDPSMLIREFCTPNAPRLLAHPLRGGVRFELPRGPVGQTGLTTWVYGWRSPRFGSIYRDEVNEHGEHATRIFVPVENLQCDVYIHESLPFVNVVQGLLLSQLAGASSDGSEALRDELPVSERVMALGGRPPVAATPLLSHYSEWVRWLFERLECDAREFVGHRFVMKYPPIPTVYLLRYALPQRDGPT